MARIRIVQEGGVDTLLTRTYLEELQGQYFRRLALAWRTVFAPGGATLFQVFASPY